MLQYLSGSLIQHHAFNFIYIFVLFGKRKVDRKELERESER